MLGFRKEDYEDYEENNTSPILMSCFNSAMVDAEDEAIKEDEIKDFMTVNHLANFSRKDLKSLAHKHGLNEPIDITPPDRDGSAILTFKSWQKAVVKFRCRGSNKEVKKIINL